MSDEGNVTKLPVKFKKAPDDARVLFHPWEVGKPSACLHPSFVVDQAKDSVECASCGERLNPMWVLMRLATNDKQFANNQKRAHELMTKLESRTRVKCDHCGKMTKIRHI